MKKKKIFFLIESFLVGGAEKVLIDIVNHLDVEKYDVTVISVFKHSVYKGYTKQFDHPFVQHVHFKSLINNHNKLLYTIFNFLLPRIPNLLFHLFISDHYDVCVAFYEGLPTRWIGRAHLAHSKKLAWLHTTTELSQQHKSLQELQKEEDYYRAFSRVVAVSASVSESFRRTFVTLPAPVVAFNPVDSQLVISKSMDGMIDMKKGPEPVLVTVGRMAEAKGYKRWLKIIKQLVDLQYSFKVWIVGGGDDTELKSFVRTNKLESVVTFWGHQSNPYPFIKQADWVVCTSHYEGLSTVILESIILQKAILTTDCPGMRELLGDDEYGIIVENNEIGLQTGVERILSSSSLKAYYEHKVSLHSKEFELSSAIKRIESLLDV